MKKLYTGIIKSLTLILMFHVFYCSAPQKTKSTFSHPNLRRFEEPYINEIIILAWENYQKGNFEASSLDFERLVKKKYIDYDILYGAAVSFYMTDRRGRALDYLNRAIDLEPAHFEALFLRAKIFNEMGKTDAANKDLELILSISYDKPLICGFYFYDNDIADENKLNEKKLAAKALMK